MSEETKELVVTAAGAIAMFEDLDLSGYQEVLTQDDVAIPFLSILQQLSPQCVDGDPLYNELAKPSMVYNSVTGELIETKKEGFDFVPFTYKASLIEWVPRAKGGGFVKEYSIDLKDKFKFSRNEQNLDIIQQGSELGTPGNQLNLTHTHVIGIIKGAVLEPAVMTMTSTQIKSSKQLNALIKNNPLMIKGKPIHVRFAHVINAKTLMRKNDNGSWHVWDFERKGLLGNRDHFDFGKNFVDGMKAGEHKIDFNQMQSEGANPAPGGGGLAKDLDEEVPF
jgi:hypothetical protein